MAKNDQMHHTHADLFLTPHSIQREPNEWYVHVYKDDNFPCMIANGAEIEDPKATKIESEKFRRVARNGLRCLTYGADLRQAGILTWDNFKSLMIKRDPRLFDALRYEMQTIFLNAYHYACKGLNAEADRRLQIFISNILAAYPFMDPKQDEPVFLPQKVGDHWELVEYSFDCIDISPQTGLLSKLIEDEDRLYAYGLKPHHKKTKPHLLFMGTTYPSGQGAELNWIYNFKPGTSVGEGHDLTNVIAWLRLLLGTAVTGHSKGGTMAMIVAALYPEFISQADCLNPTALCKATLKRLNRSWQKVPIANRPKINVYTQVGDPVFLIEYSFPDQTHVYKIGKAIEANAKLELGAHAPYYTGFKSIFIVQMKNLKQEIPSRKREFVTDVKEMLDWVMFPFLYSQFVIKLCVRKLNRFCHKHSQALSVAFFAATLAISAILFATGVLAPLVVPIVLTCGAALGYTALGAFALGLSTAAAVITPKVMRMGTELAVGVSFVVGSIIAFVTTMTAQAIISGIKIGFKSLFGCYPKYAPDNPAPEPTVQILPEQSTRKIDSTLRRSKSEAEINTLVVKGPTTLKRSNSEPDLEQLRASNFGAKDDPKSSDFSLNNQDDTEETVIKTLRR